MYCFCEQTFFQALSSGANPTEALKIEFSDGESHCSDWLSQYSNAKVVAILVPFVILIVNAISKTILRRMTRYEGYQSRPEEMWAAVFNMSLIAFINTGLLV